MESVGVVDLRICGVLKLLVFMLGDDVWSESEFVGIWVCC